MTLDELPESATPDAPLRAWRTLPQAMTRPRSDDDTRDAYGLDAYDLWCLDQIEAVTRTSEPEPPHIVAGRALQIIIALQRRVAFLVARGNRYEKKSRSRSHMLAAAKLETAKAHARVRELEALVTELRQSIHGDSYD